MTDGEMHSRQIGHDAFHRFIFRQGLGILLRILVSLRQEFMGGIGIRSGGE